MFPLGEEVYAEPKNGCIDWSAVFGLVICCLFHLLQIVEQLIEDSGGVNELSILSKQ